VQRLPDRLADAAKLDWGVALDALAKATSLIAIGRGPTLAIAREVALKLKETCNLHAEAFSSAEFQHGPMTLVSPRYPVLMFVPTDAAASGMREFAAELREKGATLFCTGNEAHPGELPALAADHPDADAVCLIQSFYALTLRLAERRGTDIEHPRHLRKVTRTR
jgi:glucosamine--fructose-6-phosphate aminotransferase (isomerizing)